ncbi:3-isopropylmalate dehydratase small subunit [Sphingomonas azotifigens]|uniref:3-isopropylmalate dehydratase small subunit n=1 Tax=Sphingomonas azotifigens TaxID=330920 RepID=UPI0009FF1C92|nr:3-isopropylmalate dehydratase small subunit [Sphingomonas azotifigens]
MTPLRTVSGRAIPLPMSNVDTDMIIPGRWLKKITRTGLGAGAFEELRAARATPFDDPAFRDAPMLIARDNFGCGSSREHAAWALLDLGIRIVIATSFSDIFAGNAFKNGIATVQLPAGDIEQLLDVAAQAPIGFDLPQQIITTPDGSAFGFDYDPFRKHCLMEGLDEIGITLSYGALIAAHEEQSAAWRRTAAIAPVDR